MHVKTDDFEDKFMPYGDEAAYKKLLAEYKRRFEVEAGLEYGMENYGKVYNAVLYGKKLEAEK